MRYWDFNDCLLWGTIGFCALMVVGVVVASVQDAEEWAAYKVKHECQRTGQTDTYTTLMPISNGTTTTMIPQTSASHEWKCAGGELVWR